MPCSDRTKRTEMCVWLNKRLQQTLGLLNHIWFSDKTRFHLNRAINNHNNVCWEKEKPEQISEKHLKGLKVAAYVAFNLKHILLEPCWLKENGCIVTISSKHYIAILNQF